jgi:hypothetical protein
LRTAVCNINLGFRLVVRRIGSTLGIVFSLKLHRVRSVDLYTR